MPLYHITLGSQYAASDSVPFLASIVHPESPLPCTPPSPALLQRRCLSRSVGQAQNHRLESILLRQLPAELGKGPRTEDFEGIGTTL
jgi:hypothetical protein